MIKVDAKGPIKIDPANWPKDAAGNLKSIWICACGLSGTFPFCDGTHKGCAAEEEGVLYEYDPITKQPKRISP